MVTISPIRNEDDYEAALARLWEIFQAEAGTPEGDERDVLADMVERYEDTHYPIPPPDPVAAIEFRMDQAGLTRRDLVPHIGSHAPRSRRCFPASGRSPCRWPARSIGISAFRRSQVWTLRDSL